MGPGLGQVHWARCSGRGGRGKGSLGRCACGLPGWKRKELDCRVVRGRRVWREEAARACARTQRPAHPRGAGVVRPSVVRPLVPAPPGSCAPGSCAPGRAATALRSQSAAPSGLTHTFPAWKGNARKRAGHLGAPLKGGVHLQANLHPPPGEAAPGPRFS